MNFREYLTENSTITAIQELAILGVAYDEMMLNESDQTDAVLENAFHKVLQKTGIHISKNKGIISHLFNAGKGISLMFAAALRGDKAKIKEISKTVKKEDVIDFLLKLDQLTLHAVTGPIHIIDALTGWHIGAAVGKVVDKASTKIAKAINTAKDVITTSVKNTKLKGKMLSNISRLEKLIPQGIS